MATPPGSLPMPTQKSVGHDSHAASINAFNLQLRQQPWYQDWFRQQGLDPNHVHLSKGQRRQLEQLILQRGGVPADSFNDMMIDPAGNLNTEHGFASQPTWLKGLEIGGVAAAGGYAAAPAFSSAPVSAGLPASVNASGAVPLASYGTGMAASAPSVASAMIPSSVAAAAPAVAAPVVAAAAKSIPWAPILSGAGGAAEAIGNNVAAGRRQKQQQQFDQQLETQRENFQGEQNMASNALDESKLDPFRDQNAQGQAIKMADRRQNRMPIVPPAAVQPYMPSGGYTPSQDARDAAGKLKLSVMAGEVAPSQLDPANYGSRGTVNTTAPVDPATGRAPFASAPAFSYDSLMNDPTTGATDPNTDLIRRRIRQRAGMPLPPTPSA